MCAYTRLKMKIKFCNCDKENQDILILSFVDMRDFKAYFDF